MVSASVPWAAIVGPAATFLGVSASLKRTRIISPDALQHPQFTSVMCLMLDGAEHVAVVLHQPSMTYPHVGRLGVGIFILRLDPVAMMH